MGHDATWSRAESASCTAASRGDREKNDAPRVPSRDFPIVIDPRWWIGGLVRLPDPGPIMQEKKEKDGHASEYLL
nr:hypothetical protein [Candidatus Sigynarchaeum springense]